MNLRSKFIIALIGMVMFLSVVFTSIAVTSAYALIKNAETYMRGVFSERFTQFLSVYYEDRGSWAGIQEHLWKLTVGADQKYGRQSVEMQRPYLIFDEEDKVVVDPTYLNLGKPLADFPLEENIAGQWQDIEVDGEIVGHYWRDQRPFKLDENLSVVIGTSIMKAMLMILLLTSLLAVVSGLLVTRQMTKPLGKLMEGVRKVGEGDLSSRVEVKGTGDVAKLAQDFNSMTEQLARNEEVRRNMVADIAHELRTPLSVILGKLESIQEGVLPSTPETILPIQDEALRLIRLVRDLQQLSLAEAGKLPINVSKVNLRQVVDRIMEQFAIEFEERNLHTKVVGNVPEVMGDLDRLTQVFVNLIGNALLHTPSGGHLRVSLKKTRRKVELGAVDEEKRRRGLNFFLNRGKKADEAGRGNRTGDVQDEHYGDTWVQVTIADSGEGIPAEALGHIFDRFYRIDKARERESGGTGLGLAIAREFVQAHGGFIEVKSRVGVGSSFRVFLAVEPDLQEQQVGEG